MGNLNVGEIVFVNDFMYMVSDIMVNDKIYNRIINKSYIPNKDVSLEDLVYIRFLHYDFSKNVRVGEIIVNRNIKDEVISMFRTLFNKKYEINSFKLIDDYFYTNSDDRNEVDRRSILDNNSYCFFYRKIFGKNKLSKHSLGLAIDINPFYNPYVPYIDGKSYYGDLTLEEVEYTDREQNNKHFIKKGDTLYKLFDNNEFLWGGNYEFTKDYQHFEIKDQKINRILRLKNK